MNVGELSIFKHLPLSTKQIKRLRNGELRSSTELLHSTSVVKTQPVSWSRKTVSL